MKIKMVFFFFASNLVYEENSLNLNITIKHRSIKYVLLSFLHNTSRLLYSNR